MKKTICTLLAMAFISFGFMACRDYETYGEMKEKERDAIKQFISDRHIEVIEESLFHSQNDSTNLQENQYVRLNNSGVYMQIVRRGCGTKLQDGENATLKIRFMETSIFDTTSVRTNYDDPYDPDFMQISRTGSNFTASFTQGLMYEKYSASVPAGWLVPFNYINLDGPTATEDIAKVRLIVPHSQGHSVATTNVAPFFYEISFQR